MYACSKHQAVNRKYWVQVRSVAVEERESGQCQSNICLFWNPLALRTANSSTKNGATKHWINKSSSRHIISLPRETIWIYIYKICLYIIVYVYTPKNHHVNTPGSCWTSSFGNHLLPSAELHTHLGALTHHGPGGRIRRIMHPAWSHTKNDDLHKYLQGVDFIGNHEWNYGRKKTGWSSKQYFLIITFEINIHKYVYIIIYICFAALLLFLAALYLNCLFPLDQVYLGNKNGHGNWGSQAIVTPCLPWQTALLQSWRTRWFPGMPRIQSFT